MKKIIDDLKKIKEYFPLKKLLIFSKSLIDTLAYLQTLKVCHRDLKPANLLVDDNEENIFVIDCIRFSIPAQLDRGDILISTWQVYPNMTGVPKFSKLLILYHSD